MITISHEPDGMPIFFWNGTKDGPGAKLNKCHYAIDDAGVIKIYFLQEPSDRVADVLAGTDCDIGMLGVHFVIDPSHQLWAQVNAAAEAAREHNQRIAKNRQARIDAWARRYPPAGKVTP